jgi:hypothetical protein
MTPVLAWFAQPTTVAGIATLLGTLSAVLGHQLSWASAIPLLVGAATGVAMPDSTRPAQAPTTKP